jgi:hypothetical protein
MLQTGATWTAGKVGAHAVNLSGAADSFISIPRAVVDTRKSYSVAAWVKLNAFDNFQTAVSMDGVNCSPFYLQWRMDTRKFALTATTEDTNGPGSAFASATSVPVLGTWYHIAGVFDGTSIKLYVNGVLEGTSGHTKIWTANGPTVIGQAKFNGGLVDFFKGQIDDVRIYQGALTDREVAALAGTS